MISNELLNTVLEYGAPYEIKVHKSIIKNNIINYFYNSKDSRGYLFETNEHINIYELAHQCKEWASSMGYDLFSHRFDADASYAYLDLDIKNIQPTIDNKYLFIGSFIKEFEAGTEPEAIFKACQWILTKDNK